MLRIFCKKLAFVERRRGIAERRGGKLFGPDEFLLAFEPLLEKYLDLAGAVGAEAHGPDDRHHFRGGDGVADLVAVQSLRASDRVGENL